MCGGVDSVVDKVLQLLEQLKEGHTKPSGAELRALEVLILSSVDLNAPVMLEEQIAKAHVGGANSEGAQALLQTYMQVRDPNTLFRTPTLHFLDPLHRAPSALSTLHSLPLQNAFSTSQHCITCSLSSTIRLLRWCSELQ